MKEAFVIYDCPEKGCDKPWIGKSLRKSEYYGDVTEIYSEPHSIYRLSEQKIGKLRASIKMLSLSLKVLKRSSVNDVIYIWNHKQAVIFHEICLLFNTRRTVISFLWLDPNKSILNNMQRRCLEDPYFIALTNSHELIDTWEKFLNISNNEMFYFPDVYNPKDNFQSYSAKEDRYIFSGGFSNRDWPSFLEIVRNSKEKKFKAIASKKQWNDNWDIPQNLEVYFDTDTEFYYETLKKSFMAIYVCLTGKSSGLINIIKSFQYSIIPLITYNDSIKEYYPTKYQNFIIDGNEVSEFIRIINLVYDYSDSEYKDVADDLKHNLQENFSGEKNMDNLIEIVEKVYL